MKSLAVFQTVSRKIRTGSILCRSFKKFDRRRSAFAEISACRKAARNERDAQRQENRKIHQIKPIVAYFLFAAGFSACTGGGKKDTAPSAPRQASLAEQSSAGEGAPPPVPIKSAPSSEEKADFLMLIKKVRQDDISAVQKLLERPALREKINTRTKSGLTAFSIAVRSEEKNAEKIMELLLSAGADPVLLDKDGDTLLIKTAGYGDVTEVERLLKIPAVRETINVQGGNWTALSYASWRGRLEIVERLLEAGADPVLPDKEGSTPLMEAVERDRIGVVQRLLGIPAVREKINVRGKYGTALSTAKSKNFQEIADMLTEAGVVLDTGQRKGKTAEEGKTLQTKAGTGKSALPPETPPLRGAAGFKKKALFLGKLVVPSERGAFLKKSGFHFTISPP